MEASHLPPSPVNFRLCALRLQVPSSTTFGCPTQRWRSERNKEKKLISPTQKHCADPCIKNTTGKWFPSQRLKIREDRENSMVLTNLFSRREDPTLPWITTHLHYYHYCLISEAQNFKLFPSLQKIEILDTCILRLV